MTWPRSHPLEAFLLRHYARGIIRCAYSVASHVGADHPRSTSQHLAGRVDRVRAALVQASHRPVADIEQRVAASMTQLGLTARLLSPVLAVACTTGVVLDVQLHDLRWQDELGGAFPLSHGHQQCTETADTDRLLRCCRRVLRLPARTDR